MEEAVASRLDSESDAKQVSFLLYLSPGEAEVVVSFVSLKESERESATRRLLTESTNTYVKDSISWTSSTLVVVGSSRRDRLVIEIWDKKLSRQNYSWTLT